MVQPALRNSPPSTIEVRPIALPRYHAHTRWTSPYHAARFGALAKTYHYGRQSVLDPNPSRHL